LETVGYSGTPLARKLGFVAGQRAVVINEPANYRKLLDPLPEGVRFSARTADTEAFVHLFTSSRVELTKRLSMLRKQLADAGMLWVSWPKKSSGVPTDITEDVIREVALPLGFVDVKVCAVDETWSGLKLVIRRELRGK
jgi:hypothetical protein